MKTEQEIKDRLELLEKKQDRGSWITRNMTYQYRLLQIQVLRWVLDIE